MADKIIMLTGDYRDYPPVLTQRADMVITKNGKVVKSREGSKYHRQATKAEIDAAEKIDP